MGDRPVVGSGEGKGFRPGGLGQQLTDGAAVGEHGHPLVAMGGGDALDGMAQATGESSGRFGSRDDIPPLFLVHAQGHGIPVDHLLAQKSTLPLTHEYLA